MTSVKIPSKKTSWKIFNTIARRYDILNHLLSCGQDIIWRKKMTRFLPQREELFHLDLATGTADVILSFIATGKIKTAIGIDMASKMLHLGRQKTAKYHPENMVSFISADAARIPLKQNCADIVTMAFGIRNLENPYTCLKESYRVLKPRGRLIILEFSLPSNSWIRALYLFYFRHILPVIGGIISGEKQAYLYLNRTVENFPYGAEFISLLQQAGFTHVVACPVSLGIATIYCGNRE